MIVDKHWQEKAKRESVCDGDIQKIINDIPDKRAQNINGRVFQDSTRCLLPFADPSERIVCIPSWAKNDFENCELQWIVFHEIGHIIKNHKANNLQFEFAADKYAVGIQCRIKFGICALMKISRRTTRFRGDKTIIASNGEITQRINRLRELGLPC